MLDTATLKKHTVQPKTTGRSLAHPKSTIRLPSIQHSKSEMFNKFLRDMKSEFIGTRYSAFWDKVVGESVSLVTSSESGDSSVTQEEAKQVGLTV